MVIVFTEMAQRYDNRLFLQVRLFNVFHTNRLECVRPLVSTASVHLLCRFSSRQFSSSCAALSVVLPVLACETTCCRISRSASRHGF